MNVLVTGGCGFIGTNFIRVLKKHRDDTNVVVLDKMTYASTGFYEVVGMGVPIIQGSIDNRDLVRDILVRHEITHVVNLAAETHVDNSIHDATPFLQTNIIGTHTLLEAILEVDIGIRFLHVSTDEVFGALGQTGKFDENSPYAPNSPYAASKAASDHLVRAWHNTYGLDAIITNCSNNYGCWQHPEKLIPKVINNILDDKPIPVYGEGLQIRDWIYVDDHCRGLIAALEKGVSGESYCFGDHANETTNIFLVKYLILTMRKLTGKIGQIEYVEDRLGHDFRYAIDSSKAESVLGWAPEVKVLDGMNRTCQWYIYNKNCTEPL